MIYRAYFSVWYVFCSEKQIYIYTHKYRVLSGIYIFNVYLIAEYILIKRADNINIWPNTVLGWRISESIMESVKNMEIEILHRREGLGFQNRVGMETFVFVFSPKMFLFFSWKCDGIIKVVFLSKLIYVFWSEICSSHLQCSGPRFELRPGAHCNMLIPWAGGGGLYFLIQAP